MKKTKDIWIDGWCIFARFFYFSIISSILFLPVQLSALAILYFIDIKHAVKAILGLIFVLALMPFVCYFAFRITKLLGKQISFPILCPKCGSFVDRKDAEKE